MYLIPKFYYFTFLLLFFSSFSLFSQNELSENTVFNYRLETLGSVANKSTTPFWIYNNSQGIIPLEANHALLIANVSGAHHLKSNIRIEAGIEIVGGTKSSIIDSIGASRPGAFLQQWYASVAYRILKLTIGAKPVDHSILDRSLSSGDFSFSANARPIPEINLSIPEFVTIPYTKNYIQFKGDFAVGKFMDDDYMRAFKTENRFYAKDILLHHKSLFFSFSDPSGKIPLRIILSVENCAQWGGWNSRDGYLPKSFKDFLRVIAGNGGGEDAPLGEQINRLGNHLGTYSLRLGYITSKAEFAVYKQHYFEDNSGMEFANWRDGIWGVEYIFFKKTFLKKILFEYIHTTNQSGPFHFPWAHKEFPEGMKARIGGNDNYYNHGEYPAGWSYFGRAIGNPLLTSPEYNDDGSPRFKNSRIKAFHGGVNGNLLKNFSYRITGTLMYGYGTNSVPFLKRENGVSGLIDLNYCLPQGKGWEVGIKFAIDRGSLYGNNTGALLRIAKRGTIIK